MTNYQSISVFNSYFMEGVHLILCIWKSAEPIACFTSKRCLGPAVSDIFLQLLNHYYIPSLKYCIKAEPGTVHFVVNFY